MSAVHVIHENPAWLGPFAEAFETAGVPWRELRADEAVLDLSAVPPEGVFYNRMSASSHTRGHASAPEMTRGVLAWLEAHGRRIVNGPGALDLEVSKLRQYARLARAGVRTPRTLAVADPADLPRVAAEAFGARPFILKPNRGGKGAGVALLRSPAELEAHLSSPVFTPPVDGVNLLQDYVEAPFVTRAEFIGGRFFYAVRIETAGTFELCPADACATPAGPRFEIVDTIDPRLRRAFEGFLAANDIEVAGIEFMVDGAGQAWTYDVNTNTNYNPDAERRAGRSAPLALARYLGSLLDEERPARAA
jgi:hypothetical protein